MCQFWNKGASKRFVEIIYSIEAVKIEVFSSSLNEWLPQRSTLEILGSSLLKILASILRSFLKNISLSFEKSGKWMTVNCVDLNQKTKNYLK